VKQHPRAHRSRTLAIAALGAGLACQASTRAAPSSVPPAPAVYASTGAPPAQVPLEAYAVPSAPSHIGSAWLFLPGNPSQQLVNFATVNGQAVLEGDIMLGPATTLPFRYGVPWPSSVDSKSAVAVSSRTYLWPNGEIPYAIDGSAQGKVPAINWALGVFQSTPLRFRPRTAADRDFVVFRELGGGCWSYLGRQGGPQDIDVTTCAGGNIAHELMHAAGFYHEQSRGDRDNHIDIVWDEISPEMRSNFDKRDARGQDIGPYDYGSIMHYPATAGSRTGNPTIIPRQANVRIGQREGLSPLDRAALEALYPVGTPAPVAAAPAPVALPQPVPAVVPSAPVPSAPMPAPSAPAPGPTPAAAAPSFTGTYSSARGAVSCNQGGLFVQCQYPGGSLFCAANGPELACTWSGAGQGRATFQRQPSGTLAGSFGEGFSSSSRGSWDLVPLQASRPAPAPLPATSPPAPAGPAPAPLPAASTASLSGNYTSTRGAMSCVESGSGLSCNFQEPDNVSGRLDCAKSQNGLELSCAWITYVPRPATGRAVFTRASPAERRLSGTWGAFLATSGGGRWDAQGI
jgi:hypothetical protein